MLYASIWITLVNPDVRRIKWKYVPGTLEGNSGVINITPESMYGDIRTKLSVSILIYYWYVQVAWYQNYYFLRCVALIPDRTMMLSLIELKQVYNTKMRTTHYFRDNDFSGRTTFQIVVK